MSAVSDAIPALRPEARPIKRGDSARTRYPAADLLHGSKAIAAHLGVKKGVAVHLIRARLIPWFSLGNVACARRSSLAAHFAKLEAR